MGRVICAPLNQVSVTNLLSGKLDKYEASGKRYLRIYWYLSQTEYYFLQFGVSNGVITLYYKNGDNALERLMTWSADQ